VQALAVPLLQKFDRISKKDPNRIIIFNSLLALTQVAQLYDGEGQLTNALVTKIQSEPTLKAAYAKYANGLPTSPGIQGYCTAQLLQIAVSTPLGTKWRATGVVANQWFGDAVKDSPMARRGTQTSAFVSLMRSF